MQSLQERPEAITSELSPINVTALGYGKVDRAREPRPHAEVQTVRQTGLTSK